MKNTLNPIPICLIKFNKEIYNQELLRKGKIRFNPPTIYNSDQNRERGDKLDGAEWVYNDGLRKIRVEHPTLGTHEFKLPENAKSQVIQYDHYFLSYSLYSITHKNFGDSEEFKIDNKMLEFGDSAVLIKNPLRFLKTIISKLDTLKIHRELDYVDYVDFGSQREQLKSGPFKKKMEHLHQREFRIIIPNVSNEYEDISIGDVSDYCEIYPAATVCEMLWKVSLKRS